ncbi:MAG: rhomboid family intramembrane serine protease [Bacteroidetes bacterium]|nr:rhomboid family intramembrane serine protease [Bacteroidota bacterium]
MKIHYNAPVILTFALISTAVTIIGSVTGQSFTELYFSISPNMSFYDPITYFRLFSHIAGHANWEHLAGNFSLILLIGPLLEEKYSSALMLVMILTTALVTGLLNIFLFHTGLYGASGIVFMLILLSSFANLRSGHVPLTFIIVVCLFLGKEFVNTFHNDTISQFAHIIGGLCGSIFGYSKRVKPDIESAEAI